MKQDKPAECTAEGGRCYIPADAGYIGDRIRGHFFNCVSCYSHSLARLLSSGDSYLCSCTSSLSTHPIVATVKNLPDKMLPLSLPVALSHWLRLVDQRHRQLLIICL